MQALSAVFMSGFLLSLSLCLDLGLVNVAVIRTGLEKGMLPAFLIGVGSSIGDLTYAIASMVGISLLMRFVAFRWVLWIGGTLILVYLSFNMIRQALRPKHVDTSTNHSIPSKRTLFKSFFTGIGLALSSPTAILWFAAVGGSVIAATTRLYKVDTLFTFFVGFFIAGILWSFIIAFVSGQARKIMGTGFLRVLSLVSAGLFVYFAYRVFLNGLHTLV